MHVMKETVRENNNPPLSLGVNCISPTATTSQQIYLAKSVKTNETLKNEKGASLMVVKQEPISLKVL